MPEETKAVPQVDLPVDHLVALQEEAAALQEEPATTSHHLSVPIRSPSSL